MASKSRNKKKTICKRSLELVVSIAKFTSLSLASMSLRSVSAPPRRLPSPTESCSIPVLVVLDDDADHVLSSVPWFPRKRINGSSQDRDSHVVEDIDAKATAYIGRIKEKNRNDLRSASKRVPIILPPPPSLLLNNYRV